ncbi:MAG: PQQ-binding-like beta-propeller repeat protein [Colwellia sp.]|nr:PQQ-binding-like beta-propeller repeat protein [Colwellia sp.]MCW8863643.1 PQQ-binding-like beta-propeller repeat protein [Colwellia sp.]MCW9080389.1 PQQ-binding-like beta-propeller repeat protein [Colwellia sp.]
MSKVKIVFSVFILLAIALLVLGNTTNKGRIVMAMLFTTESTVKPYDFPEKTQWRPVGPRNVGVVETQMDFARVYHSDTHGSDEAALAMAPAFEFDWLVEENLFLAEGPLFDSQGNLYFCPIFPPEEVIMVSLEPSKGERRWVLPGFGAGCGAPFIYSDPITKEETVYVATYDRAIALKTDGTILWDLPTGLPSVVKGKLVAKQHSFGVNYHSQLDALVAVMGDGSLYVLDRKTGKQLLKEPFVLPGDKVPVSNFSLPKKILAKADADIAHMYSENLVSEGESPTAMVLHSAAGELQKVTNFFSIDQNTGRLWIAASLMDEDDGVKDGWSDWGGLYGIDLVSKDGQITAEIQNVFKVNGGTSSTPAISADGKRIYVGDAFDSIYAVDASTAKQIWKLNLGAKVNGSLVVSSDNGEIYANIREQIVKVIDRGDHAEKIWATKMDMYDTGILQQNFKSLGAEIGANGLIFTGAAGVIAGNMKFPLKLGAGFIDRETGEIKYFADGSEDSVNTMVGAPDGAIYVGNSPLRRVIGRAILGNDKSPAKPKGGVTKFKPIRYDLFVRDSLWAAANRAENTANLISSHPRAVAADIKQISSLLKQGKSNITLAVAEGSLSQDKAQQLNSMFVSIEGDISAEKQVLLSLSHILKKMVDIIEK